MHGHGHGSGGFGFGPPRLGMGRGMSPGTRLVREGAQLPQGKLPKGLVRRVWREFAYPFRRRLGLLLVAIAGVSALTVVPPLIFRGIVNVITAPGPGAGRALNTLALAALVAAVAVAAFSLWQRYLTSWVGEHLVFALRSRLFDHVQRMPVAFFTRTQTGALLSRLNNDVQGAQRALTGTFGTLAGNVVQVVAAVTVMFALEWRLTLLVLSFLPVFVVLAKVVGRRLQELTRRQMVLNADMNTIMTERLNVAGALLVKLFGDPRRESEGFASTAREVADVGVRSAVASRLFFIVLGLMGTLGAAAAYWLGGHLVLQGDFQAGDVVGFALLVTQAYGPLSALSNAPVDVLTALVSFDRVFEILDVDPRIDDRPDAVGLDDVRGEVAFEDVTFAYPTAADSSVASLEGGFGEVLDARPGAQVLKGVSFVARPGETVALVGPSGSGKTTICNLVPRLYDVAGGTVRLDGHDVRSLTLRTLGVAVGVVTQDPHLFHDTVRANLRYARTDATDEQIAAACRAAQIHDVITALPDGYDTIVGERGYRLSGGEKQRVALARVLLKDPAVVVLDEATAHLDSESELAVQRALATALAGRTSIVIAHRLSTIVGADQILVVVDGRVVERGTHDDLVARAGPYRTLYRTQFARTA